MKNQRFSFIVLIIFLAVSCSSNKSNDDEIYKRVGEFADLECRAITLKDKRFELANQLRFTQDTLMQTSAKADTVRLKSRLDIMNKKKESLTQASLALADSIHQKLDSLMKNTFTDKESKATFDEMLDSALKERGCTSH